MLTDRVFRFRRAVVSPYAGDSPIADGGDGRTYADSLGIESYE